MDHQKILEAAYYSPVNSGSFGGVQRLKSAVQNQTGLKLNTQQVKEFLSEQDAYTLHKNARIHFPRNRVFVSGPLKQFQADLCDMQALSKHNDGFNYLLTVIDVFSKKAYVRVLKSKTGTEVEKAFESIFHQSGTPRKLQTDLGTEFFNKKVQSLLKRNNILHFATPSDVKASVIERFNRTLKTRMWRYFTAKNTLRYVDCLQEFVESYNNSFHSSIKMTPLQVTSENSLQVLQNLYGAVKRSKCKFIFKKGDPVRISKLRGVFEKKYEQSFTGEIFTISDCLARTPPVYKIKDFDGEEVKGSFYEQELQKIKVSDQKVYHVDKVLKKRTFRGEHQVLVSWKNWPEKFNSWIKASDLHHI